MKPINFPRPFYKVVEEDDWFYIEDEDGDLAKEMTDYGWLSIRYRTIVEARAMASEIRRHGKLTKIKITGQMRNVLNSMFFVWWRWQGVEFEQYSVLLPAQIRSDIFEAMLRGPNV